MKNCLRRLFSVLLCAALLAPVLPAVPALAAEDFTVQAEAAVLLDADYGEVLLDQNAHAHRYPASITKVMTALLTLEAVDRGELALDQVITVQASALTGLSSDGSTQNIKAGEELTVLDLLYCTLVASANEACNILAEAVAGSVSAFVERMNTRAAELGMEDTHFANTHGLHNAEHYTSAYDITLMTVEALKNDTFRTIVSAKEHKVAATNLSDERHFYNTNALLSNWKYIGYTYAAAIGVKTGHTPEAGQCLVSAAVEGGRTMVAVVMGAENITNADGTTSRLVFSESKRLLQWGFSNFSRKTILDSTSLLAEVNVTLSDEASYVTAHPDGTLEATLPVDLQPEDFDQTITLYADSVEAPVAKGQVLGEVTVSYDGKEYGKLNLVAVNDVSRSELLYNLARIKAFFGQLWVRLALVGLGVLLLVLLILRLITGGRSRGGRGRRGRGGYGGGGGGYGGKHRRR